MKFGLKLLFLKLLIQVWPQTVILVSKTLILSVSENDQQGRQNKFEHSAGSAFDFTSFVLIKDYTFVNLMLLLPIILLYPLLILLRQEYENKSKFL